MALMKLFSTKELFSYVFSFSNSACFSLFNITLPTSFFSNLHLIIAISTSVSLLASENSF